MDSFIYTSTPSRVIFGQGKVNTLPQEAEILGVSRCLILCTKFQTKEAEMLTKLLSNKTVGIFDNATMHTPIEITNEALGLAKSLDADSVISIGGGSTIGLGKAIAFKTGMKHICIPTTYAGSEMTPILGQTVDGKKTTQSHPSIKPEVVIYDVDLTLTLPVELSLTSSINAIAHAVEALYAPDTNPIIQLLAADGIRSLAFALPEIKTNPSSISARTKAQYGAWLCAICLGSTKMGLHHKICHVLGGSFNLPHADTHTAVLPHVLAFNAPSTSRAMELLAEALPEGKGDAVRGLNLLFDKLGVERGLKRFGMKESDVEVGVQQTLGNVYSNPREVEEGPLRELIRRCWAGEEAVQDL